MPFEIRLTVTTNTASLAVAGILDGAATHAFQGPSQAALQLDRPDILIDFAGVESMDTASAGMLILFDAAAKARGKRVIIANPCPSVLQMLDRTHVAKLITIA